MKTISLIFGALSIIFMGYALYLLFNITEETIETTFFMLLGSFISIVIFLTTDIIAHKKK